MLFLSTHVQTLIFRNHIIWRTFQLIVSLRGNSLSQLFFKLRFSFSYLILHFLILFFSFLILFYFHFQNGLACFKVALSLVLLFSVAGQLFFLNYFLYFLKFNLDVVGKFAHFERGNNMRFIDSFYIKFIELKTVNKIVLEFLLSSFSILFIPSQLFSCLFLFLINTLLESCSVLRINN